jgi:hypothetical protein
MSDSDLSQFPSAGRDNLRLLVAYVKLIDALQADSSPTDAMRSSFEDVLVGFGAERGVLLDPMENPPKNIVCHKGLKPEQLGAIAEGMSAPGVSSSLIQTVKGTRAGAIFQHPLLNRSGRRTAALAENHSAICAPVLDPTETQVRAIYYFQNTGPSLAKAYKDVDLVLLQTFTQVISRIFTQREMSDITSDATLTLAEIRNHYTARALRNRVAVYKDNYEKAAESLGTTRSTLYRLLSQFDILTRGKQLELERAGEKVERNLRGGDEGAV